MISLKVFLEKVENKGEDSSPIAEQYKDGSGLVAAFDGMGGAGSQQYSIGEKTFSGAWFASRITKSVMAAWFRMHKKKKNPPENLIGKLPEMEDILKTVLKHALSKLDTNTSKLKSSLHKRMPTTLTGIYFEPRDGEKYDAWAINAGDSRSYALRPDTGMQQISEDDLTGGGNALENLYGDSKISNCINADTRFKLNTRKVRVESPVVFLAASDGCFDYVPFPAHWEHMLLDSMMKAASMEAWREDLAGRLRAIASDDTTLGLLAIGWNSLKELQQAFRQRHEYLETTFVKPIEDFEKRLSTTTDDKATLLKERENLRKSLWEKYASDYENLLKAPELHEA